MNRTTKIILFIVVGLLVLCLCTCLGGSMVATVAAGSLVQQFASAVENLNTESSTTDNPEEVAQIARAMVDYTLPPGYQPQSALTFLGMDLVAFENEDSTDPLIMMVQAPPLGGLSRIFFSQIVNVNEYTLNDERVTVKTIGTTQATIRDQNVTFTIREGSASDGTTLKQMTGMFNGKDGLVFLFIIGAQQTWNEEVVDSFIGSLH